MESNSVSPITKAEIEEAHRRYPYLTRDAAFYELQNQQLLESLAREHTQRMNDRFVRYRAPWFEVRL